MKKMLSLFLLYVYAFSNLLLQNGNEIDLNLKPETTIYLDSDTGKMLLP
jgi:hypothetical protein